MKKQVEAIGKTVEEAKQNALAELGEVESDRVEYTVLEEPKKGILGIGAKPARVSAVYEENGEEIAVSFLKNLIADMELNLNVSVRETINSDGENMRVINLDGEGAGTLIGYHGETLDALQYLASLAANRKQDGVKKDYVRITIDAEGYRAKRAAALRGLARRMSERVLRYKKSVMLEPMNPYERRIIHSEVQSIPGVSTNSIGSEDNRKIVIYLDGTVTDSSYDEVPRRNNRYKKPRTAPKYWTEEDEKAEELASVETSTFESEEDDDLE